MSLGTTRAPEQPVLFEIGDHVKQEQLVLWEIRDQMCVRAVIELRSLLLGSHTSFYRWCQLLSENRLL